MTRWALFANYNLENSFFNNPVITLSWGEVQRDRAQQFFPTKNAKGSHWFRLAYEINVN